MIEPQGLKHCAMFRRRVTGSLEERQSAGHDEIGHEEAAIDTHGLRREEEQRTSRIESESHDDTRLVTVLTDEDGGRESHAEIASIEGHLYKSTLSDVHAENL